MSVKTNFRMISEQSVMANDRFAFIAKRVFLSRKETNFYRTNFVAVHKQTVQDRIDILSLT